MKVGVTCVGNARLPPLARERGDVANKKGFWIEPVQGERDCLKWEFLPPHGFFEYS